MSNPAQKDTRTRRTRRNNKDKSNSTESQVNSESDISFDTPQPNKKLKLDSTESQVNSQHVEDDSIFEYSPILKYYIRNKKELDSSNRDSQNISINNDKCENKLYHRCVDYKFEPFQESNSSECSNLLFQSKLNFEYFEDDLEGICKYSANVIEILEDLKRISKTIDFPKSHTFFKIPKSFIMPQINNRFKFNKNFIDIHVDDYMKILFEKINNEESEYLLNGIGGIGKSHALFMVQSFLRLNDDVRVIYFHDVKKLLKEKQSQVENIKKEIYFTFYNEIEFLKDKIQPLSDIENIFETIYVFCNENRKRLVIIFDNFNAIDYALANYDPTNTNKEKLTDTQKELYKISVDLNTFIRRILECDLKVISASCNNDTKTKCDVVIENYFILNDTYNLNVNCIKAIAKTFYNLTVTDDDAKNIYVLTNGIYLEVNRLLSIHQNGIINGVKDIQDSFDKYYLTRFVDFEKRLNKFLQEKINDESLVKFIRVIWKMNNKIPFSFSEFKFADCFLMYLKEEKNYYSVYPRNLVAFDVLNTSFQTEIAKVSINNLNELWYSVSQLGLSNSAKGDLFEKLMISQIKKNKNVKCKISLDDKEFDFEFDIQRETVFKTSVPEFECEQNHLFIPKISNYPIFDFFITKKFKGIMCLFCISVTIGSIQDHLTCDLDLGLNKSKMLFDLEKNAKEKNIQLIEVFLTTSEKQKDFKKKGYNFLVLENLDFDKNLKDILIKIIS